MSVRRRPEGRRGTDSIFDGSHMGMLKKSIQCLHKCFHGNFEGAISEVEVFMCDLVTSFVPEKTPRGFERISDKRQTFMLLLPPCGIHCNL